jgi:hypothetical protein
MGKNRKKGSRAFTPAVSAEKNNQVVNNFISSVITGTVTSTIRLGSVNKSLGDARWEVRFYTRSNNGNAIENVVQCTKAGNLSRRGVFIASSSIVVIDDIGSNHYQIIGVLSKDDVREFKKIDSELFWVPEQLFNIDAKDDDETDDIIFEESNDQEQELTVAKVPYKRKNIINKDVIPKTEEDDVDVDAI